MNDANMPQSFEAWLGAWAGHSESVPCYNPRDMMTFGFVCSGSSSHTAYQNAQRTSHVTCELFAAIARINPRQLTFAVSRHRPDEFRQGAGEEEGDMAQLANER